jgi:hypothetical protein
MYSANKYVWLVLVFMALLSGCASTGGSSAGSASHTVKQVRLPSELNTVVPAPAKGNLWYLKGNKPVVLEDEKVFAQASIGEAFNPVNMFTMTAVGSITVQGLHSFLQLGPTQRTFYTRHNPALMGINRFTLYPEDQRRYVTITQRAGSTEASAKNENDDIAYSYTRLANDIYKITITGTLSPGEYGIFAPGSGKESDSVNIVYTFSVAP